jgi:hypothetical protein
MAIRDVEEYLEWEKQRTGFMSNLVKTINPVAAVGFLALLIFGAYAITSSKINPNYIYVTLAAVVILILFKTDKREKEPIPENVMKIIATTLMRRKIGGPEYPNGTIINPNGYCKMRFMGEWGSDYKPWKWEMGFEIIYANGLKETRLVILNPYEGYVTGIVKKPSGYTGEDSNDLKVLMPLQLTTKDEKPK